MLSQSEILESPLTKIHSNVASFHISPWECLLTYWGGGGVLLTSYRMQGG